MPCRCLDSRPSRPPRRRRAAGLLVALASADGAAAWRGLAQFSAPSQATTLLQDAILQGAGAWRFNWSSLEVCAGSHVAEWFNPMCQMKGRPDVQAAVRKCFSSEDSYRKFKAPGCIGCDATLWRRCSEDDFAAALAAYRATRSTFVKDNFVSVLLDDFVGAGFVAFVALRPPWLTFPTRDQDCMYAPMYERFLAAPFAAARPGYASLARLQALPAVARHHRADSQLKACLGHYLHFFHLVSRAKALGVPVVRTDRLLEAPRDELAAFVGAHLPAAAYGGDAGLAAFASKLESLRSHHHHRHGSEAKPTANTTVAQVLAARHVAQWGATGCAAPICELARACEAAVAECGAFNREYGADEQCGRAAHRGSRERGSRAGRGES